MQWFKGRYVRFLEQELSKRQAEVDGLRRYNEQLIERLLAKNGISPTSAGQPANIKTMLETTDIFEDILDQPNETTEHPITDNRKDRYDEFVA